MNCEICGIPSQVEPLYRVNAKGVPGIWRCERDLDQPVPRDLKRLVDVIADTEEQ